MVQFRTKARTVEHLGKSQIADLPTAISELWKNGYDAYGDKLDAFLYTKNYSANSEPLFVIMDDGKGMSRDDILDKWFVLGTDSKSRYEADKKGEDTLGKEPRVKMGEKGIGRLAVAYLGPQMVMLTKKKNNPLEIVFFDWRILENFNLFLSDVNIPIRSITIINDIEFVVTELKKEFLLNFPEIKDGEYDPWEDQQEIKNEIIKDCKSFIFPQFIIDDIVNKLIKQPTSSHGTAFIISKPDPQILELAAFSRNDETRDKREDDSGKHTFTALAGLFNPFIEAKNRPETSFLVKDSVKGSYNILDFATFFSPEDIGESDHSINGTFDEYGCFDGEVRIYKQVISHKFSPFRNKATKTYYGPFTIQLGIVVGADSMLNDEQKRYFDRKLDLFGGLYIYRDGFRVLPYGSEDNDFLEFESRRGKHAGEYFFAKRRMFGFISITREKNSALKDKSSREGFITNAASRDFKVNLIEFFIDLAKKYFGTSAEYDYKRVQQNEIQKKAEAQKQEHERDKQARKEFAFQLNTIPKQLDSLQNEYKSYLKELEQKSNAVNIVYEEIQSLVNNIEKCKVKISDYKITKPSRFKPTELQKRNFNAYNKKYQTLVTEFDSSDILLNKVRDKLKVHELFKEFEERNKLYKNTLSSQFEEYTGRLDIIFKKIKGDFEEEKKNILIDFDEKYNSVIPAKNDAKAINRSLKLLESIFNDSRERIFNRVTPYLKHLEGLNFDVNEDDLVGYYKDKFEEMKEEWNKTYELAQLGIAVEIIDHQFNSLYSQLAESIKSMKTYLQPGKEPETKYKNLDTAFDHLQDNYKLLQPLYRTTGRIRNEITGKELKDYTEEFFKERFKENKISYTISKEAEKWSVYL